MEGLTPKKIQSIALLCEGIKQASVSSQIGVTVETLRRWAKNSDYRAALVLARRQIWSDRLGEASAHLMSALRTLQDIYTDPMQPASARVSAAKIFIDLTRPDGLGAAEEIAASDEQRVFVYLPDNGRGDRELNEKPEE